MSCSAWRAAPAIAANVSAVAAELDSLAVPVVGGSGAYRGVRGQLTAGAPVEGVDSVDVLDLDR
jgi:hypothetical protein